MNIILVGMPGSGKSSVAKRLAEISGFGLFDTDAEIVKRHGEINKIFKSYGEEYFRDLETAVVKHACELQNTVISTGGGCLLRKQNAEAFKNCGKIVYLKTSVSELFRRLKNDNTRPLVAGDTMKKLEELERVRAHIYAGYADITVQTDGLTVEEIAQKIEGQL